MVTPLFVSLVIELGKDLPTDVLDLVNVAVVVLFGEVNLGHLSYITIQRIDGASDVVQHPAS